MELRVDKGAAVDIQFESGTEVKVEAEIVQFETCQLLKVEPETVDPWTST